MKEFVLGAVLALQFMVPAGAQMPAPVQQLPVMRETLATLNSYHAKQRFPAAQLKAKTFETLPAEIEIDSKPLFSTLQYLRAVNPKQQGPSQLKRLLDSVGDDAVISDDESLVLEAFARGSPLTVSLKGAESHQKPVALNPKPDESGVAAIRNLQVTGLAVDSMGVMQLRLLCVGGAREWLSLYRGNAEDRSLAVAILRMGFLKISVHADGTTGTGTFLGAELGKWLGPLNPNEKKEAEQAIHDDMVAINAKFSPPLFPEYAFDALKPLKK